ncbi:MAG: nucleotidyltransferase family protein [Gemmatimonadales bacterium]
MTIAGVVLAAGRSSRMGAPKALLDYRGQPFVASIVRVLEALELHPRVVVVGDAAPRIRAALAAHDVMLVENPWEPPDPGPISSIRAALAALEHARPQGVLVWPVDYPHVRTATIESLVDAFRAQHPSAVLPVFGGRRGHPVLWSDRAVPALLEDQRAGTEGARAVLHSLPRRDVREVAVGDPAVLDGINTPEDYERLIRGINQDAY